MNSDRIFGLVVIFGALAFFASALQIQSSFLTDPVGPRIFPMIIAGAACLSGLVMVLRPDPSPEWPQLRVWIAMAGATLLLVGYAYALAPLGFLLATALAAAGISWLISPRPVPALLTGICLSGGLFLIFKYGLGLGLVALPKAFLG